MEDNGIVIRGVIVDSTPEQEESQMVVYVLKTGNYQPVMRLSANGLLEVKTGAGWQRVALESDVPLKAVTAD